MKMFLNNKDLHMLYRRIPVGSPSRAVLKAAVRLDFFGANTVLTCTDDQARNLLLYAEPSSALAGTLKKTLRLNRIPTAQNVLQRLD